MLTMEKTIEVIAISLSLFIVVRITEQLAKIRVSMDKNTVTPAIIANIS